MRKILEENPLVLMEAAVNERLRRSHTVRLHETLVNAPLIYDQEARDYMGTVYREYMDLASRARLPLLVCTPTWRANASRVENAGVNPRINQDAVAFMRELPGSGNIEDSSVLVGGLIGCKNDCYRPEEALSVDEARQFHAWQIDQLCEGGVDFLIAETLPNIQEALGIARAMEPTGLPYVISLVISRDGHVLDGSSLREAIDLIDANTECQPLGFMVNCAHPSFLCPEKQPATIFKRLIGYLANASSLDHCDLEQADELKADEIDEWGRLMLRLNEDYGVGILGGCCGTGSAHLDYLVRNRESG